MKPVMYRGTQLNSLVGQSLHHLQRMTQITSATKIIRGIILHTNSFFSLFLFFGFFFGFFSLWKQFSVPWNIVTSSEESKTLESVGGFISYADKQVERNSQFTLSTNAPLSPLWCLLDSLLALCIAHFFLGSTCKNKYFSRKSYGFGTYWSVKLKWSASDQLQNLFHSEWSTMTFLKQIFKLWTRLVFTYVKPSMKKIKAKYLVSMFQANYHEIT